MISPSDDSPSFAPLITRPPLELSLPLRDAVGISGASQRLRALSTLSGSLTDALGPQEAAQLVEMQALSALAATSAVVVTLGPFPASPGVDAAHDVPSVLRLVHAIGLPAEL